MSQFYTLKEFFTEAKAIIGKLEIPNKETLFLRVSFDINENEKGDEVSFRINYSDERKYSDPKRIDLFAYGSTPEITLKKFENKIREQFELPFSPFIDRISEDLAIELHDPDNPTNEE